MLPSVSVIMPTYNRSHMIAEAIDSVLMQMYQELELIIIDDGSTDSTSEVVARFRSKKIKYFKLEKIGRSGARNFGLKQSIGSYISFIDSDDLFLPFKIKKQVELLEKNPEYGMIYTAAYCIDGHGERIKCVYNREDILEISPDKAHEFFYYKLKSGDLYYDLAFYVPLTILLPTVMLRREVYEEIGDFDVTLDRFEDTDYWRRISKKFKILGWDEPSCKIRTHVGNELCNVDRKAIFDNMNRYANKVRRDDRIKGRLRIRKGLAHLYLRYAQGIFAQPFWRESLPFLVKALIMNPFDFDVQNLCYKYLHKVFSTS